MKTLTYILNAIISMIILILLEGVITFGQAFNSEIYSWIGYIFQTLLVLTTIIVSVVITNEDLKEKK